MGCESGIYFSMISHHGVHTSLSDTARIPQPGVGDPAQEGTLS
jgi:hypothetical protein